LWTWQWTFGFHKVLGSSWVAEQLAASQEGLSSMSDWVSSRRCLIKSIQHLVSWGGLRLRPLGTSATIWPIVPAPDDRWWVWSSRWNENWQGKPKYSEKTYPSATLSTTNPTWPDLGSILGRCGGKLVTNRLSYGTVLIQDLLKSEYVLSCRKKQIFLAKHESPHRAVASVWVT
jgi:hypothetical protein